MSTLRTARQTYKDAGATTDAWFIRIERADGAVIRITNASEDISMTTRVLADATTEAIGSTVVYHSASGYNPTSVGSQDNLKPGMIDLEGILDSVTASSSGSESKQHTPSVVTASDGTDISLLLDGVKASGSPGWDTVAGGSHSNPEWAKFDFKQPVRINRVKVYIHHNSHWMSIMRSDDGKRYDEVTAEQLYDVTGSYGSFTPDINLPYTVRSRYIQLKIGSRVLSMREVEFFEDTTPAISGTIARVDIENGLYDNARVKIFLTDYTDPYEDDEKMTSGYLTNIELRDGTYLAQFTSLIDVLTHRVGRKRTTSCDAELGSFRCGVHLNPPDWTDDIYAFAKVIHDAASGTWVKPTTPNGYYYYCSTEGTVGSSEPTWPTTPGNTVADGSAVWTTVRAFIITDSIATITDSRVMTVNNITSDGGIWGRGTIEFTSGVLTGVKSTIFGNIGAGLRLAQPVKTLPSIGDTVILTRGCVKRFVEDCRDDFDNSANFQGSLYIPGRKIAGKRGGQG